MVGLETILNDFGQRLTNDLIKNVESRNVTQYGPVNNTGKLRDSIRWEVEGGTLRIYAAHYMFQMVYGRKPGKFPPRQPIIEWIEARGIVPANGNVNSLAFLIQRKIAEQGTTIYQQGGSDIVSSVINQAAIEDLRSILVSDFNDNVVSMFSSQILEKIAA